MRAVVLVWALMVAFAACAVAPTGILGGVIGMTVGAAWLLFARWLWRVWER